MIEFCLGTVVGFVGHFVFYDMSERMPAPELSRDGIGTLLAWPIAETMRKKFGGAAFPMALVSVGLGAAMARFLRSEF